MGACNKEAAPQQKKCDDDFDTFVHLQLRGCLRLQPCRGSRILGQVNHTSKVMNQSGVLRL